MARIWPRRSCLLKPSRAWKAEGSDHQRSGCRMTQEEKAAEFRSLHEGEPFIIPNPWDVGSARVLEVLGFKALATTSSGFAFTLGRSDWNVTLDELCAHVALLASMTSLPISVDMEN